MRKFFAVATAVAGAALLVGCIETKQDYTLNPDGSGKAVVEIFATNMMALVLPQADAPDPELEAKRFVKQILDNSKGIDAWSDIGYERTVDNRLRFVGTAYFKDFKKLKIGQSPLQNVSFGPDDKGGLVLEVMTPEEEKTPSPAGTPPAPPPELTDEQVTQRLAAERAKYQQVRPMMQLLLGKMKVDLSFQLPGKLEEVTGFAKEPSGAVRLAMDGAKVLAAADALVADDAVMRERIRAGNASAPGPGAGKELTEMVLGGKGPFRARTAGPLKPLFAYEAEVKAAQENYEAMIRRLGLDNVPDAPPQPTLPPGFGLPGGGQGGNRSSPSADTDPKP